MGKTVKSATWLSSSQVVSCVFSSLRFDSSLRHAPAEIDVRCTRRKNCATFRQLTWCNWHVNIQLYWAGADVMQSAFLLFFVSPSRSVLVSRSLQSFLRFKNNLRNQFVRFNVWRWIILSLSTSLTATFLRFRWCCCCWARRLFVCV